MLAPGALKINSTNADQEDAQEELEIDYAGDGLDIGFNVNYLLDVLLNVKGEQLKFALGDALGSALMMLPESRQVQVRRHADENLIRLEDVRDGCAVARALQRSSQQARAWGGPAPVLIATADAETESVRTACQQYRINRR